MDTVLAIDPGSEQSAWVLYRPSTRRVLDHQRELNAQALARFAAGMGQTDFAVEMIASYGMAVGREVFETCVWIGRFLEAIHVYRPMAEHFVYRRDVKLHLCHSPKANDSNVRAALIDLFGPTKERAIGVKKTPGPLYGVKADEWSALAVAVTYAETRAQK